MIVVNPTTRDANISTIECVLSPDENDLPFSFDANCGERYLTETLMSSSTDPEDSFASDVSFNPPPTGWDGSIRADDSTLNWSFETLERTIDHTAEDLDLNKLVSQPMEGVDSLDISHLRELVAMSLFLQKTATTSEAPRSVIDAPSRRRIVSNENRIASDLLKTCTEPLPATTTRRKNKEHHTETNEYQEFSLHSSPDVSLIRQELPEEVLPALFDSASLCLWSLLKMK